MNTTRLEEIKKVCADRHADPYVKAGLADELLEEVERLRKLSNLMTANALSGMKKVRYQRQEIAALKAEQDKYENLLKAVDRVTFLNWNTREYSAPRMRDAMDVLLDARKVLPWHV